MNTLEAASSDEELDEDLQNVRWWEGSWRNGSGLFQDPTITYEEVTRAALTGRKAM